MHRLRTTLLGLGLGLVTIAALQPAAAATFVIVNNDGVNEGFNDPTPATPVGGNPGTTIGAQRLNVFQYAGDIWGAILPSNVTIRVASTFDALTCSASSAVLGSAGPIEVDADFAGAIVPGTWYHIALANKLAGVDLSPGNNDITARFNSSIDNNDNCLANTNWYYGLDGNEGPNVDLVAVVLHELGHGLGFSTLVSLSTGALFSGMPDAYARFMLDNSTGLHWDEMTNAQRQASAVNTGNVVWDGATVTAAAPLVLGKKPIVVVNAPPAVAGTYDAGTAAFGPPLSISGLTQMLVLVDDGVAPNSDACTPIVNVAQITGRIALIDRGTCTFASKVKAAQNAGAVGAIIVNNVAGAAPALGGSDPTITIPSASLSLADGNALKAQLGNGVSVTLTLDLDQMAGADPSGRVLLFAPNPVQSGSSISHWDTSAFPNLLMEPSINRDLDQSTDLTRYHFQDLGWFEGATDVAERRTPAVSRLHANVPNPFNPMTSIRFDLGVAGSTKLSVYDVSGRPVTTLYAGRLEAGPHRMVWNGTDGKGRGLASGVYIVRLDAPDRTESRRVVLMK